MTAPIIRRSPAHAARVVANESIAPRMRRITVQCDAMVGVSIRPAQDIELHLRESGGRAVKRRYTIRSARAEIGELDLDVLLHGDFAGSNWGAHAQPGDTVRFQGPRGKLELRSARQHVLCGDESALPAISAICAALPADEPAVAVIEVADQTDELPVAAADVRWVHRRDHPPGTPDLIVPAAREVDVPFADTHAYLLGETRSMVALRALFEERGVPHDAIFLKGYWNIGRPDRIAGAAPST